MSPEEFDNRLRSTFNDEYLPPKEHLWANINSRLDQKPSRPVWYWLAPVIVVFTLAATWIGSALISNDSKESVVTTKTEVINEPSITDANTSASTPSATPSTTPSSAIAQAEMNSSDNSQNTSKQNQSVKPNTVDRESSSIADNTNNNSVNKNNSNTNNYSNIKQDKGSVKKQASNNRSGNTDVNLGNIVNNNLNQNTGIVYGVKDIEARNLSIYNIRKHLYFYNFEVASKAPLNEYGLKLERPKYRRQTAADLAWGGNFDDYKWWFNFGIGAQSNFNHFQADYNDITKTKIHRYLIQNQEQLTNNGNGFQAHFDLQYKFGKNNRFSFESGLNYSSRNEDIKMNEQTYDIAARGPNDSISTYLRLKLFIAVGTDTTFFDATQSFAMVSKNKYSVYTIPLRFKYELPINKNTFVSLGVGGGVSYIKAKSNNHYYNLVDEKSYNETNISKISASLNSILSVYTNYNGIGQFGVYAGYQTYLSPFTINNQYSIRMSDLQYGVTFKKPLEF